MGYCGYVGDPEAKEVSLAINEREVVEILSPILEVE